MVLGKIKEKKAGGDNVVAAQDEAPTFEKVSWYKEPGLRKLYWHAFVLCVASATTGYDGMFFNSVQVFDSWKSYFGNPQGGTLGLLGALYQIGAIASILLVPFLADNYGRKLPIIIGCVIMIVGSFLQGFAKNMGFFMGGRVLLGFGNSLAQISSPMLLTEICHPQHRGRLTAVYNCLWNAGAIVETWLAFGTNYLGNEWSWRIPGIVQAAPSVIQLAFIWWVPESPRFLIANDKQDQALQMLAKYHANGNVNDATVQFEYREIKETLAKEMEYKKSSSYVDFFRTKGNRYRLVVLISLGFFSQWSGNAIISNYANKLYNSAGITNTTAQFGLSGGQTILSLIISTSMALLVDRYGRRPMFLASTAGMCGVLACWTLSAGLYQQHGSPGADKAMIFFIYLFGFFYSVAWSGLLVGYAIEILPYKLRAKGLMCLNICVQAALCLNTYVNPLAFEGFGGDDHEHPENDNTWKLYLIYTCWVFCELCFVYFMYVETKGPTLEELAKVIDGDEAEVARLDLEQVEKEVALHGETNEVVEHKA